MAQAAPALAFSYSRSLAPLMWAFACIMAVELAGRLHLLVSLLWSSARRRHSLRTDPRGPDLERSVHRSFKRLPVMVGDEGVLMRLGSLKAVRLPADRIAGARTSWPSGAEKRPGVLNLALINYPNVMLDVDPPLPARRRSIQAVAHRLDDPSGFVAAVGRLKQASEDGGRACG